MNESQGSGWSWPYFVALTAVQIWAAHAFVFFIHEYSHSFAAWILGWKSNPLAINYAHPTPMVLLLQLGMSEKVNYDPIFASGREWQAAIIGVAGALVGNALITYSMSRWGYAQAKRRSLCGWAMLAYWICVASVGNFIDYVPVRTFTDEGDMGHLQRGFGWSPWTVLLVLGMPTAIALVYFFCRIEPETTRWLFPQSPARRMVVATLTAIALFGFYGAAGLREGGPICHKISLVSVNLFVPGMILLGILQLWRNRVPAAVG